ncbi:MAG: Glycosyl transferase family 2 [Candidatus Woesebacteria bacterium GW2011_GWB1_39_12]|uniref:Glycosyl transferase family 2 n=2 Tax=Candidatus Woeseibacteriota TaxID=1752722 RepID=A0A0G0M293_9BACT|nr:MAG: Glycosyl transferase family 2 [Candidatus Woesebacteria bacterium GW2011_GWA1_39_12]KKR01111.1 MAG: Glycosyl transferase family 2 [Candidatus Woesebacteria bacterium GW2011_GWB1_39_12]
MIIHVYSVMKNEERLLPYFLRYYSTFADRIFITDDGSTDKTIEIAKKNPKVTLLSYNFRGDFSKYHNACFYKFYKKYSRGVANWVMCPDGDEFLYNKDIIGVLSQQQERGIKAIKASGMTMFSENFPTTKGQIYEECYFGVRSHLYDKMIIFNPEINVRFNMGKHITYLPKGASHSWAKILLLHYRYISRNTSLERLYINTARYTENGLRARVKIALGRWNDGVKMIKEGTMLKVI